MHCKTALFPLFVACTLAIPAVVPLEVRVPPNKHQGSWPFTMPIPPCSPDSELVEFAATYNDHWAVWTDQETGIVTVKGHNNLKGTGVGLTSGQKYQLSSVYNEDQHWTFIPPFEQEYHAVQKYQVVKQGGGRVYESKYNVYWTWDPIQGMVYRFERGELPCF